MSNAKPDLKDRLTNGEVPSLDPYIDGSIPAMRDVDATSGVLRSGIDVLLLTATAVERNAVLHRLTPLADQETVLRIFAGLQTYYLGRLGSVTVALTMCRAGSQTRDGATLVIFEAIDRVRPRAVIAVGMAFGGYTDKAKIADVLLSTRVVPYEASRKQEGGDVARGGEPEAGPLLLNRFREAIGWRFVRSDGYQCQVHEGAVLSGEKLVDSLPFKFELFSAHPEAVGGEMEGSGVYAAASRRNISEWLIVKAICDWGDGTKHKVYQAAAAAAAVSLVEHVFSATNVLVDLPPYRPQDDDAPSVAIPTHVVNNTGGTIGTLNIVAGNQTIHMSGGEIDVLLSTIKILLKNGLVDEAGESLSDADTRAWGRMDVAQKARLLAMRAWRKMLIGDPASAAQDFLAAHEMNPTDERGLVYKCQALWSQGLRDDAFREAHAILVTVPSNPHARAFLIMAAPPDVPIDDLLPAKWRLVPLASEVAIAAAERVRSVDLPLAESILRGVEQPKDDDLDYWAELGSILAQANDERHQRREPIVVGRIEEAVSALKRAFNAMKGQPFQVRKGFAALTISRLMKRLGHDDERIKWLETARELLPDRIEVATERGQAAYDRGKYADAIELLRPVVKAPNAAGLTWLVLAHALVKLATPDAIHEACTLLDAAAGNESEPAADRKRAAVLLAETQLDRDRDAVAKTIEKHQTVLGPYQSAKLQFALAEESGYHDQATQIARTMLQHLQDYSSEEVLDLGQALHLLDMNEECLSLLESRAPRNELTSATKVLIQAAMALGRLELVASVCAGVRLAGVSNSQIVDAEAYVRALRGDLTGALSIASDWLSKNPNDKRVRLRLAMVARELGRIDLLPHHANELPTPTEREQQISATVVDVLRAAGEFAEARRFAYENLKKFRKSEWAWKALMQAGMPERADVDPQSPSVEYEASTVVHPGCAVRISEKDDSRWIRIEESDALATGEDEYGPEHAFAVALVGKTVGDNVELHRPAMSLPARTVRIESIMSCFTRAYQECMSSYERQFPDSSSTFVIHVPESVDDLLKILAPSIKERRDSIEGLMKEYAIQPTISLYGLAGLCDRSIFDIIPYLVTANTVVHASRPAQQMARGRDALRRTREIVIEATAVSTLMMLGLIDRAKPQFDRLWIATPSVDAFRVYVQRGMRDRPSGYLGAIGDQLVLTRLDKSVDEQRNRNLRSAQAVIEGWDVFAEVERQHLAPTDWDAWGIVAGAGTAEAIHRAKRLNLPLWTDDLVLAAGAAHVGVDAISTQAVFETLAESGRVSADESAEVGAKLVGWDYVDTRTPPESFLAAAKLAKWDSNAWPLVQHLTLLTRAAWPAPAMALVVADVFRLWWNNHLDRKSIDAFVIATLIRLAARANGHDVFTLLLPAIHRRFGLDVIGAQHISEVVVAWLNAHG